LENIIRRLDINKKYCVDTAIKLAGIVFTLWSTIALFVPFDNIIDEKYPWFVKLIFALLIIFAIFIFAYIICAVRVLRQNSVKLLDVGNNHGVYVQYGDVFSSKILGKNAISNKRNILISVNRCFDTIVDDDLISSRSLHGTAMRDLYTNSAFTHDSLNKKIQSKLKGSHCELINKCDKPKGNQLRYEAGCVAEIEANSDVTYFFLGLTCFDKQLHPYITDIEYVTAISKALDYCLKRNQGYPVIIPIIGGGMAGTNKSEQDILNYLVRLIIMNRQSINCDIHIVVRESARSSIAISELKY